MIASKSGFFFFAVNIKCCIWEKDLNVLHHLQKCRRVDLAVSETMNYVPVVKCFLSSCKFHYNGMAQLDDYWAVNSGVPGQCSVSGW